MKRKELDPGEEDDIRAEDIREFVDDPHPIHYSDMALPVVPSLKPFWKRASRALFKLYEMKDTLRVEGRDGGFKEIEAGRIKEGDKGFRIVKEAISRNRPELVVYEEEHGKVKEIGIAMDIKDTALSRFFRLIIPGDVAYLRCEDGFTIPFLKGEWERRQISTWTATIVERYTGYIIIALVIAWTAFSLIMIWT